MKLTVSEALSDVLCDAVTSSVGVVLTDADSDTDSVTLSLTDTDAESDHTVESVMDSLWVLLFVELLVTLTLDDPMLVGDTERERLSE